MIHYMNPRHEAENICRNGIYHKFYFMFWCKQQEINQRFTKQDDSLCRYIRRRAEPKKAQIQENLCSNIRHKEYQEILPIVLLFLVSPTKKNISKIPSINSVAVSVCAKTFIRF